MKLLISSTILADVQQLARSAGDREICGILFGTGNHVARHLPTTNIAADPRCRFEIDPAALIAAERAARAGGEPIIGYFHSHPGGQVSPSLTDAHNAAADGRIWLIINGSAAAAWRAVANGQVFGRFDAMPLDCHETKRQTSYNS